MRRARRGSDDAGTRGLHLRGDPHATRAGQAVRVAARGQADLAGRRPDPRAAAALPWSRSRRDRRRRARRRHPGRRPGRRHRPVRRARRRPAGDGRGAADRPVLRLRARGGEHRGDEGPLRDGGPGPGRRSRVDVPRADGLRRRRLRDGPGHRLRHRVRPAGHRCRSHRHPRRVLAHGCRHLRRRVADPGRKGVGERLVLPVGRPGARPQRADDPGARRARAPRGHAGGPRRAAAVVRRHR